MKKSLSLVMVAALSLTLATSSALADTGRHSSSVGFTTTESTDNVEGLNQNGTVKVELDDNGYTNDRAEVFVYRWCPGEVSETLEHTITAYNNNYERIVEKNIYMKQNCSYRAVNIPTYSNQGNTSGRITLQNWVW
ncbi:hypothetical protein P4H65_24210 [Paenibacillus chitinolyticus]|uniref:hypothetical protein n=1 Tax=Paenibacillus chitinolyticus TaxID=79263 RepID=UPI002DBA1F50|nr:hypothetical protein [Paenibacillus chitinolyticus]MEC0248901.1 hypothetical protein [Paenibacillus chitinolyticus]